MRSCLLGGILVSSVAMAAEPCKSYPDVWHWAPQEAPRVVYDLYPLAWVSPQVPCEVVVEVTERQAVGHVPLRTYWSFFTGQKYSIRNMPDNGDRNGILFSGGRVTSGALPRTLGAPYEAVAIVDHAGRVVTEAVVLVRTPRPLTDLPRDCPYCPDYGIGRRVFTMPSLTATALHDGTFLLASPETGIVVRFDQKLATCSPLLGQDILLMRAEEIAALVEKNRSADSSEDKMSDAEIRGFQRDLEAWFDQTQKNIVAGDRSRGLEATLKAVPQCTPYPPVWDWLPPQLAKRKKQYPPVVDSIWVFDAAPCDVVIEYLDDALDSGGGYRYRMFMAQQTLDETAVRKWRQAAVVDGIYRGPVARLIPGYVWFSDKRRVMAGGDSITSMGLRLRIHDYRFRPVLEKVILMQLRSPIEGEYVDCPYGCPVQRYPQTVVNMASNSSLHMLDDATILLVHRPLGVALRLTEALESKSPRIGKDILILDPDVVDKIIAHHRNPAGILDAAAVDRDLAALFPATKN